ncbi:MAG: hypothetical protein A2Z51_00055 [Deltaproteobacteria bacterium RBG_19FT_COMBO_52_11]|nr:MAG: hypothetical protein A2Z51_00055 [Deltaproteobacteria bacterium RBG_19FT_COMBO_52_11]
MLRYNYVMKNFTITLDEEVARWARIRAEEKDTSVSRLVGRCSSTPVAKSSMNGRFFVDTMEFSP